MRWLGVVLLVCAIAPAARAQCRRTCAAGEARDPWGCCVASPRRRPRPTRRPGPENLVGDADSTLSDDLATEVFHWARAWMTDARASQSPPRRTRLYRRAAGACLIFLEVAATDPRAGSMRAWLVESLDRAGLADAADHEARSLGGARAEPLVAERELRSDSLLNLAWGHQRMGQRLDGPRAEMSRRRRAVARFERAADYYRLFVRLHGDETAGPGARSELASCLIAAGAPLAAARELEALAAAVPERRTEGLRRALDAHQRAVRAEEASGRLRLPDAPPPPSMRPPWTEPPPIPELVRGLIEARDRYVRVAEDEPTLRREQALEGGLLLYRYARFDEARPRLLRLLSRCDDDVARRAADALTEMGVASPCEAARSARCEGPLTAPICQAPD